MVELRPLVPFPPSAHEGGMGVGAADAYRYPHTNINNPHANDVLCGRGGLSNSHVGNISWRKLISENQQEYLTLSKRDKSYLSRKIVNSIRNENPPGRFLKKNTKTGLWCDIGDKDAHRKTSQALREGAPERRQQKHQEVPHVTSTAASTHIVSASANTKGLISKQAKTKIKTETQKKTETKKKIKTETKKKGKVKSEVGSNCAGSNKINVIRNHNNGHTIEHDSLITGIHFPTNTKRQEMEYNTEPCMPSISVSGLEEKVKATDFDDDEEFIPQQKRQYGGRGSYEFARQMSWGSALCSSSWGSVITSGGLPKDILIVDDSCRGGGARNDSCRGGGAINNNFNIKQSSTDHNNNNAVKLEEMSLSLGSMSIITSRSKEADATIEMSSPPCRRLSFAFRNLSSRSLTSRLTGMSIRSLSLCSLLSKEDMSCGSLLTTTHVGDEGNNANIRSKYVPKNMRMPPLVSCVLDYDADYDVESDDAESDVDKSELSDTIDNSLFYDNNDTSSVTTHYSCNELNCTSMLIVDRCPMSQH